MSRRQALGRWLSTSDAALSWAERIAKLVVLGIGSGVLSSAAGIVIGFITGNPISGLVIGVVVGMVILVGFAVQVVRIAVAGAPPQPITERSQAQVREVEQEREQTQADKRALQQELEQTRKALEQARADASVFGAHTIVQEDAQSVIERLRAEIEVLKAQPGDEELKSECFKLSTDCYQFIKGHGGTEIGDYSDPEVMRRNDEVMLEYDEVLGGRVNGLFRKLQRRGWWQPETVEAKKRKHIEDPGFLSHVQEIARELNAIGHEH